jgi:serine-aspartate repeat-containing protein C/D/E
VRLCGEEHVDEAQGFEASARIGNDTQTAAGGKDCFLVKYDAAGAPAWSRAFGGTGDEGAGVVAVDSARSIYLAAPFQGTASFGGDPITADPNAQFNTVLAKYDTSGALIWHVVLPLAIRDLDMSGDALHAVGAAQGSASADVAVLRVDPADGHNVWMRTFGGPLDDMANAVAVTADGGTVVTGNFGGNATFGAFALTSAGGQDAFVVRLSP